MAKLGKIHWHFNTTDLVLGCNELDTKTINADCRMVTLFHQTSRHTALLPGLDQGPVGGAASLQNWPEGKYEEPDSKHGVKADLGGDLQGSEEEVLDEDGEGGDVSHTEVSKEIQEESENPSGVGKKSTVISESNT